MENLDKYIKRWVDSINNKNVKLDELVGEVQENMKPHPPSQELNSYIRKILLHLANSLNPKNPKLAVPGCSNARLIFKFTHVLCSKLIIVPESDSSKYLSALYFIAKYMLDGKFFPEAEMVTSYVLPRSNIISNAKDLRNLYADFANLWGKTAVDALNTACVSMYSAHLLPTLQALIKNELDLIRASADGNYTEEILQRLRSHLERFKDFCVNRCLDRWFLDFAASLLNYATTYDLSSGIANMSNFYETVLSLISIIFFQNIRPETMMQMINVFNVICNIFEGCFIFHREYFERFKLFQTLVRLLLKDISKKPILDAGELKKCVEDIMNYGDATTRLQDSHAYAKFLDSLFRHWEDCISREVFPEFLDQDNLALLMDIVDFLTDLITGEAVEKCRSCNGQNCRVKKDLHNGIVLRLHYLDVFTRIPVGQPTVPFLERFRRFLRRTIALIEEMKQLQCEVWNQFWGCIRIILYVFDNRDGSVSQYPASSDYYPDAAITLEDKGTYFDHQLVQAIPNVENVAMIQAKRKDEDDFSDSENFIPGTPKVAPHRPRMSTQRKAKL